MRLAVVVFVVGLSWRWEFGLGFACAAAAAVVVAWRLGVAFVRHAVVEGLDGVVVVSLVVACLAD